MRKFLLYRATIVVLGWSWAILGYAAFGLTGAIVFAVIPPLVWMAAPHDHYSR